MAPSNDTPAAIAAQSAFSSRPMERSQLDRLRQLLTRRLSLGHPSYLSGYHVELSTFAVADLVRRTLIEDGVVINDVRLEGSGAAHCLTANKKYNDVDMVFHLASQSRESLEGVRHSVLRALGSLLPARFCGIDEHLLSSIFVQKMFISPERTEADEDAWVLLTLPSFNEGRPLDLKFVQHLHRPYQFSMDSFQIVLDMKALGGSLPTCVLRNEKDLGNNEQPFTLEVTGPSRSGMPPMRCECAYGDMDAALAHLSERRIAVQSPDEMAQVHGGGLLKFVSLLCKGYTCVDTVDVKKLEKYMCTRFQIDCPLPMLAHRLSDYLNTHLLNNFQEQYAFLRKLKDIMGRSGGNTKDDVLELINSFMAFLSQYVSPYGLQIGGKQKKRNKKKRNQRNSNSGAGQPLPRPSSLTTVTTTTADSGSVAAGQTASGSAKSSRKRSISLPPAVHQLSQGSFPALSTSPRENNDMVPCATSASYSCVASTPKATSSHLSVPMELSSGSSAASGSESSAASSSGGSVEDLTNLELENPMFPLSPVKAKATTGAWSKGPPHRRRRSLADANAWAATPAL